MHWVLSTAPGRWEEVEGASNQRTPGSLGTTGQCSRSWACCRPVPDPNVPPYKDRCHPQADGIHSPHASGGGGWPYPSCSL